MQAGRCAVSQRTGYILAESEMPDDAEFIIVGSEASSSPMRPFASILLATNEKGRLVYRGKVGTGFGAVVMKDLAARMDAIATEQSPLAEQAAGARKVRWVRPELVAQVKFAEFTADGHIRHGSFQALREDKMPDDVSAEGSGKQSRLPWSGHQFARPRGVSRCRSDQGGYRRAITMPSRTGCSRFCGTVPSASCVIPTAWTSPGFFQKHAGPGFPLDDPRGRGRWATR